MTNCRRVEPAIGDAKTGGATSQQLFSTINHQFAARLTLGSQSAATATGADGLAPEEAAADGRAVVVVVVASAVVVVGVESANEGQQHFSRSSPASETLYDCFTVSDSQHFQPARWRQSVAATATLLGHKGSSRLRERDIGDRLPVLLSLSRARSFLIKTGASFARGFLVVVVVAVSFQPVNKPQPIGRKGKRGQVAFVGCRLPTDG